MTSLHDLVRRNLHLVSLRSPTWGRDLEAIIGPLQPQPLPLESHAASEPPQEDPVFGGWGGPVARILELVSALQDATLLVEPYVSTDFQDEYSVTYSRVFTPIQRDCWRVHVFASSSIDISSILRMDRRLRDAYKGYFVARPLTTHRVGPCMLAPPWVADGASLVHALMHVDSHILGHRLSLDCCPFIQQETRVSVCAEAVLWMVLRILHAKGECGRFRPSEIVRRVYNPLYESFVADGLYVEQIASVLQDLGIERAVEYPKDAADAARQIYAYVESELPVVVGTPGHVMAVIGHCYPRRLWLPPEERSFSGLLDRFIVHDDSRGPYLAMELGKTPLTGKEHLTLDGNPITSLVVPLPARVSIRAQTVFRMTDSILRKLPDLIRNVCPAASDVADRWDREDFERLVLRHYLRRSDVFKAEIHGRQPGMHPSFVVHYWRQPMPRYIWVVELSRRDDVENRRARDRRIRGEIVFDSTASGHDPMGAVIAVHWDGALFTRLGRARIEIESNVFVEHPEEPYQPLLRMARA